MHDTTDHTLIAAYRTGDHEAYAVLVARYEGVVRAACRRQVAGAEIDDCVQAVFLVLARRPASATRVPILAAWLLRVASYVCRRAQRSAGRRTRAERAAAMISHVNEATSCDALDYLDDCLIRLPERQRVAVSLHYLAGKAPKEVATALGISRDNAYQLVSRGVARLRVLLSRRGVAISGPALLALISAEAQAAEFDTLSTSTIVSALSAAPTDHINHLADGALDTMATPFYIPIAAAAFCASLGITAVFLTQSSGPTSSLLKMVAPPVVNSIQSYSSGLSESESIASILAKVYTMDFDTKRDSSDIFSFLEKATKQKFVSDQGINPAKFPDLNFKVDKLSLKNILGLIERMLHLTHTYQDGVFAIHAGLDSSIAENSENIAGAGLSATETADLKQQLTLDITNIGESEFYDFCRRVSCLNFVLDPAIISRKHFFSLSRKNTPMVDILRDACEQSGARLTFLENVIYIDVDPNAESPTTVVPDNG